MLGEPELANEAGACFARPIILIIANYSCSCMVNTLCHIMWCPNENNNMRIMILVHDLEGGDYRERIYDHFCHTHFCGCV